MPPARRRFARAFATGVLLGALVTAVLPAIPTLAKAPIEVRGREVVTSVERQRVVPLPITASHVALSWRGDHEAQISVAFAARPSAFGEDVPVVHSEDSDHEGDEAYSPVLWTDNARFVRITTDRPLGHVTVHAIDAQAGVGFAGGGIAVASVASAATTQPSIIRRADWGADEGLRHDSGGNEIWPPEFAPMQKAIVHHTAGLNNDPNPAATVRAIYYMYAVSRDYGDIGYNFLIDEQGRIYEGRFARTYGPGEIPTGEDLAGNVVRGAHARDYNDATVGIVLLGTFMNRLPTAAARASLEKLLAWKVERHGIDPLGASTYVNPVQGNSKFINNISGHRNVNATACPGDTFYPTFGQLRQNVANRIAATSGGNDSTPPAVHAFVPLVAPPTGASSIKFGLTFAEPVTGLAADDFAVNGSSNGWAVANVSGAGSTYAITIEANNPDDGSIELTLAADAVTDLAGHAGPASAATAESSFGTDEAAPTVGLYQDPHRTYHNGGSGHFDVTATFNEPVTGFFSNDILLGGSSHSKDPWHVGQIYGSGASYGFTVSNDTWADGTLTLRLREGAVADLAGNPNALSGAITMVFDRAAPVTSKPRLGLRGGSVLDGTGEWTTLTWTASDVGAAGIAWYDLRRSIDGGAFHTLAASVTGTSVVTLVKPGRTYRYEVRARDKAGNYSGWNASPTFKPRLLQQTHADVVFKGETKTTLDPRFSSGSQRHLASAGALAKLKTTARSLSFITTLGPNRGAARIYIDGVLAATVNLNAPTETYRYVAFTRTWSSAGTHSIKVVAVGNGRVDVDAFGVLR